MGRYHQQWIYPEWWIPLLLTGVCMQMVFRINTILGFAFRFRWNEMDVLPAGALVAFYNGLDWIITPVVQPYRQIAWILLLKILWIISTWDLMIKDLWKTRLLLPNWNKYLKQQHTWWRCFSQWQLKKQVVIWCGTESHGVVGFDESQWLGLPACTQIRSGECLSKPLQAVCKYYSKRKSMYSVRVRDLSR